MNNPHEAFCPDCGATICLRCVAAHVAAAHPGISTEATDEDEVGD